MGKTICFYFTVITQGLYEKIRKNATTNVKVYWYRKFGV